MSPTREIPIGERVRFYREAQHKKQTVVAGLAGISVDYLSQIERGLKTPTIALLHLIARVLGVPTSVLLGEPPGEPDSGPPGHPATPAIHRALMSYGSAHQDDEPPDLGQLRERIDSAFITWSSSPTRYSDTGILLPDLVTDTEHAIRAFRSVGETKQRREALRLSADLNFLLRTFFKRTGRIDLCLLAADRGMRAAEDAEDPLRIAAARWNLGHALAADNHAESAEEVAVKAAEELEPLLADSAPELTAMYGALWLVATWAAVRKGDAWTARSRLREKARPAAERTGESNVAWTAFGPTNVGIYAVNIEMEAGEVSEALRLADEVDTSRSPSIVPRAMFLLDLARCYDQRREGPAVLLHLLRLERESPEEMRYDVLARDLVRSLVKRARPSFSPEVRGLAARIGLFAS